MRKIIIQLLFISSLFTQATNFSLGSLMQEFNIKDPKEGIVKSFYFNPEATTISTIISSGSRFVYMGSYKDFKADIFFSGMNLNPDIALEFFPIWSLGFSKIDYDTYMRKIPYIVRKFSDISLSVGNKMYGSNNYKLGVAVNYNLVNISDFYFDSYVNRIQELAGVEEIKLVRSIAMKEVMKLDVSSEIKQLSVIYKEQEVKYKKIIEDFRTDYWNALTVYLGYAFVLDYYLSPNYMDFRTNGYSQTVWLQTGFPIGKDILVSQLAKYNITSQYFEAGLNIKFGNNEKKTGFIEGIYRIGSSYEVRAGANFIAFNNLISLGLMLDIDNSGIKFIQPFYKINFKF
jgi:hypothetical protein